MTWLVLCSVAPAEDKPAQIIDATTVVGKVIVMSKDGTVQIVPDEEEAAQLNEVLSDVVEAFLHRTIQSYEDLVNPPKYSGIFYLFPGDDMGVIEKDQAAKTVKTEELPEAIRRSLGGNNGAK